MESYKFYIKRIKFIKNLNDNEDIENLWVICLETGDMVVKVSNYLKKYQAFFRHIYNQVH